MSRKQPQPRRRSVRRCSRPKRRTCRPTLSTPDPGRTKTKEVLDSVNAVDSCRVPEVCIDEYLWSLCQRTPKHDSVKVVEQRKVTVVKKGNADYHPEVREDFTWKDPKAAEKTDMPARPRSYAPSIRSSWKARICVAS
jgi:hypothetical protein